MWVKKVYEDKYKQLLVIPFLLLLFAVIQIGYQYAATGDFVHKGISLKGGSTVTIEQPASADLSELEQLLQQRFPAEEISVRTLGSASRTTGIVVESAIQQEVEIKELVAAIKTRMPLAEGSYTVEITHSSLGRSFFKQTVSALIVSFILMGLVVFFYFRTPMASLIVILAALSDIIVTLAIFNLTGIKLSSAGVAAFLMLIGYSVDTDILLSTRMLKRQNEGMMDRIYGALKTGATMTITTLAAVFVALVFAQNEIIKQIMIILFIGLLVDPIMTYIQNAGLLRMYLEKKTKTNEPR